jgi:hypothetical protein
MIEQDELLLVRLLRPLLRRKPDRKSRLDCLDEESIGAYLDGGPSESERGEIEIHLVDCRYCLDHFLAAAMAASDGRELQVPSGMLARAMALMPQSKSIENVFTIIIELMRDSLALIFTSGRLSMPITAAQIRGKDNSADIATLQIEAELGQLQVGVEIERLEGDLCQIVVHVKTAEGALADGLRFNLLSGGREHASYFARLGAATFERVPPGEYQLAVTESGKSLGAIELTIKEESRE